MTAAVFAMDPARFADVYGPAARARIAARAEVLADPGHPDGVWSAERLAAAPPEPLSGVEVLCTGWGGPVLDAGTLARLPRLRLVLYAAGSVRRIAGEAFWAAGVPIVAAARANAVPVAEFAVAQAVYALKGGWRHVLAARAARAAVPAARTPGAYGSTVGVLSLGEVGRLVCELLRGYDVEVLAHDPYAAPPPGVRAVGIEELFAASDVLSVHTPLLPETRGLVGRPLLASMKPGATLLNTARGAVLDEPALLDVLRERPDLFAVLDVTDPEPPLPGSPLFTLPNVVVTPHLAGSRGLERRRLGDLVAAEFERWTRGEPLRHALDPRGYERMA
ncbi:MULTISPECIES: hydroxyacid dehydrogenase [Kitasatospora]|uniref:Putative oxidoreductase n=1 Tax=Kitasatospora setae (strain ATCC 33774 / DSM 43861 / JCM 3304 / KCC A-0304 / NBRC 14216 / KM-6054) TaxID=452652 RepID=E4N904_KITSK|nr:MULTISPECIES: hydroxyacid dehydrogenase [Kitasatospora]BAJ27685.1 putative oxidoreductase [Kitasatospora setae KM-6054]